MKLKSFFVFTVSLLLFAACKQENPFETHTAESNGYTYEYVTNDPLNVRIYTLKNGLKVYLSDYKNEPRIQSFIAVKAGGKNDPADNTGLAHYLEHIMFKGTSAFGTLDWEKEKVLLDSIEDMFQHYRTLTDAQERKDYYKLIDHVSGEASAYAIPNEYDKMVSAIGAQGTNAYTSEDRTVYMNNIPSNQLENWLSIESDRFKMIVPRLFHTELEAVYEEKNRSLDNDYSKSYEAMYHNIYKKHPYGTQTVIGTIEHLKNPSITAIKAYFDKYYVPNNVAICLSGDLDYDKTIKLIDQYFGDWKPNEQLPVWHKVQEDSIAAPIEETIIGPYEEWVTVGFRFNGFMSEDHRMVKLVDMLLANSAAGLIDLNLKQQQKVLNPTCYVDASNDYAVHMFEGNPREGQSLEEVRDLLLSQIELIKKGEFEDWLIEAVINDFKKTAIEKSQENEPRSHDMVMAFTSNTPWISMVTEIEEMKKIKRDDIIKFVKEHYKNNYVVIYKRSGKDPNVLKVEKPEITKVALNREQKSPFHEKLLARAVQPIMPVFVDYEKDLSKATMNRNIEVLYKQNTENELFDLYYLTETGTNNDPKQKVAVEYLEYLGTDSLSAEEFKKALYRLGCNFDVSASPDQTYVSLHGLSENMIPAMKLFESLLANPRADADALSKMIEGELKERDDNKKNKGVILYQGLLNYGIYGARSPFTNVLSNKQLHELKPEDLLPIIKNFTRTEHKVLYYGPMAQDKLISSLNQYHRLPDQLMPAPTPVEFRMAEVKTPAVFWTDYDMVQAEIGMHTPGPEFDATVFPRVRMYNEYFGGNMGSIVFQEIREAQGLAYSVWARYNQAQKAGEHDRFFAYVGTQADKQRESMKAMMEILNNMPESATQLETARKSVMSQLESERITRTDILFNYLTAQKRGLDYDIRKDIYEQTPKITMEEVKDFQQKYIKNKPYNYVVLGSKDKLDFKDLQKYGKVTQVSLDELFGYEKEEKINMEVPK